ncbi:hypothetical protein GCM10010399_17840 [Dactylosporangium fulvum]
MISHAGSPSIHSTTRPCGELLQEQYDDAVAKGATVLVPGGRLPGAGFFFVPAVLTDITPEMRLHSDGLGRELGRSGMDQFADIKTYGVA